MCLVSFITLYPSKYIYIFIHSSMCCDLQGRSRFATSTVLLYFWWSYRTQAADNSWTQLLLSLPGSSPFKRKHTFTRCVYSRERMWSKMVNLAESFPRPPPTSTSGSCYTVGNLPFIIELDFPRHTARKKIENCLTCTVELKGQSLYWKCATIQGMDSSFKEFFKERRQTLFGYSFYLWELATLTRDELTVGSTYQAI